MVVHQRGESCWYRCGILVKPTRLSNMTRIKTTKKSARVMALGCDSHGGKWRWISVYLPVDKGADLEGLHQAEGILETIGNLIRQGFSDSRFVIIGGGWNGDLGAHKQYYVPGGEPEEKA